MSNCGVPGVWAGTYQYQGLKTWTIRGFSLDNPYYDNSLTKSGCSNYGVIRSSCDGRIMLDSFTCNVIISDFQSTSFTPDNLADSLYDCINNACIISTEYNTPGLYKSLSECEQVCGTKGCSGKCLSNKQWSIIQELARKAKNTSCN
ncbi:MAG: hypothetical protein QNJ63_28860 [Calothrix sp. MO_192.B10]|nr:hypothetical protein [Calothrix sp. MO_192.B10]